MYDQNKPESEANDPSTEQTGATADESKSDSKNEKTDENKPEEKPSGDAAQNNQKPDMPKTGDTNNLLTWIVVMLGGITAIVTALTGMIKKRTEPDCRK